MTGHSAHTELPWKQSLPDEILIVGPGNEDVAQMSGHYQTEYVAMEANAAFIVRAVNSHYQLLEALKAIRHGLEDTHSVPGQRMTRITKTQAFEIAAAAIAKAEART